MSAPSAADAAAKPRNKKPLVIGLAVVVLAAAGGAAWFVKSRQAHADDEEGAEPQAAAVAHADPKAVPTFLAMENMVVNLADPGGDRFAQIGITLELDNDKTAERVKVYLPAIRSGILMAVSQRTSQELLTREGKDKLAADVLREVSKPLGLPEPKARKPRPREEGVEEDEDDEPPRRAPAPSPVRRVLFSSFIIQ
ncbi:flagellar basal body-associated FliL family protein [Xylophilus sp.]|uniref:flagellar basal body-associated FliL family protein n=1 Tax=Xylophilus sp. TaxID=2653893 RepID=UPI002D7E4F1E|nr:flagellar basal body-associated FliL family protein [Xylophilus sp.]